jgi:hypothetical protein
VTCGNAQSRSDFRLSHARTSHRISHYVRSPVLSRLEMSMPPALSFPVAPASGLDGLEAEWDTDTDGLLSGSMFASKQPSFQKREGHLLVIRACNRKLIQAAVAAVAHPSAWPDRLLTVTTWLPLVISESPCVEGRQPLFARPPRAYMPLSDRNKSRRAAGHRDQHYVASPIARQTY